MGKFKTSATGQGYVGETMVHKISREVGVVESVVEARDGWPPQITLKLADGSCKKGSSAIFGSRVARSGRRFRPLSKKSGHFTQMASTATFVGLVCRSLLGLLAVAAFYFASYFGALSLSARTRISTPIDWVVYTPIPFSWRMQMAQFWMTADPKVDHHYSRG